MNQIFNYTSIARNVAFKFPLISALSVQIIFWTLAYVVLGTVMFFSSEVYNAAHNITSNNSFLPLLISSIIMGILYGTILGFNDQLFFKRWSKGKSLGKLILLKGLFYFFVMICIFGVLRYVVWTLFLQPLFFNNSYYLNDDTIWKYYFIIVSVYTFFMSIFISFIIQINKRFGPGLLLPLVLGKYVHPKIEQRAFIFLDLKSSTTHAEELGHIKYSELIRDCFIDINQVSIEYQAEIYQYVGDEIVLCWLINDDTDLKHCIDFYFKCQANFNRRKGYYLKKYNILPEFKAGLHKGTVTGVEVGDIKRELAFHGDTLNVAARIQAMCNQNEADILISEAVHNGLAWNGFYQYVLIGNVELKGRKKPINIYKVYQE